MVTAECLAVAVLLAVMVGAIAQLAVGLSREHAVRMQHTAARREAANLMTQAFALPWEQLNDEQTAAIPLTAAAESQLKGVEKTITVEEVESSADDQSQVRKIAVSVRWDRPGGGKEQAELTAWRHAPRETGS